MSNNPDNPYIDNPNRLNDVIAAIQVMGIYKFYSLTFEQWAIRITGNKVAKEYWEIIFKEHPEFFRFDKTRQRASLVWRRSKKKLYDLDKEKQISREEYDALSLEEKKKISRTPLNPQEIESLINIAVQLHSQAIEHRQEKRYFKSLISNFLPALLGVIIGMSGTYMIGLKKQENAMISQSLSTFAEAAFVGQENAKNNQDAINFKSQLAVYAPPGIIKLLGEYHASECGNTNDIALSESCKTKWANLVNEIRVAAGKKAVDINDLKKLIFFEDETKKKQ